MPHSLAELEERRNAIAQRIAALGDLRPGSVSSTPGRCGKSNCRCHQSGRPGHGPNLRLTYKGDRKTFTEWVPTPASEKDRLVLQEMPFRIWFPDARGGPILPK